MADVVPARVVGTLMTREPIVANVDMPLIDAVELMDFYRVSGLPVIDWDGRLVGVISQTDLLHARGVERLWGSWPGLTVRHLMTEPAVSVRADTTLNDAAQLMEDLRIHRLVVVASDDETPVGVLSVSDLVHDMATGDPL